MNIFIGHKSALEFWRLYDLDSCRPSKALPQPNQNTSPLPTNQVKAEELKLSMPLHLEVADYRSKRKSSLFVPHCTKRDLPQSSFLKFNEAVFVACPELTFREAANDLNLIQLIRLGYELCGFYSLGPCATSSKPTVLPRKPRTTPEMIRSYLQSCPNGPNKRKAIKAAGLVLPSAASPMETNLSMLLSLPTSLGGFGLPAPKLNYPIRVLDNRISLGNGASSNNRTSSSNGPSSPTASSASASSKILSEKTLRCDLCWPDERFALEYDSDQFHSGRKKLNKDSRRRALLESAGIHVVSVTKKQILGIVPLREIANITAKQLGVRLRIRRKDFDERHLLLRRELRR
ncbi:MAG: hypothetical protein Q4A43_00355 [Coriobacteriia bacterium]|nr:hypothetical protein [Coriobacteriia bacterium]